MLTDSSLQKFRIMTFKTTRKYSPAVAFTLHSTQSNFARRKEHTGKASKKIIFNL